MVIILQDKLRKFVFLKKPFIQIDSFSINIQDYKLEYVRDYVSAADI